jgi:hypothetical protein
MTLRVLGMKNLLVAVVKRMVRVLQMPQCFLVESRH